MAERCPFACSPLAGLLGDLASGPNVSRFPRRRLAALSTARRGHPLMVRSEGLGLPPGLLPDGRLGKRPLPPWPPGLLPQSPQALVAALHSLPPACVLSMSPPFSSSSPLLIRLL